MAVDISKHLPKCTYEICHREVLVNNFTRTKC